MRSNLSVMIVLLSVVTVTGCATSRGVVDLTTPLAESTVPSSGRTVHIRTVKDNRIFQVAPPQPNIPSLDPDEPQDDSIKARAIGRKRSTFGKALSDILLREGRTVASVVRESLEQAFTASGYRVVRDNEAAPGDAYIVDADITKFWSWMNPGFWAITLSTEISTDLVIRRNGSSKVESVSVKAADQYQTGVEENWMEVMQMALKEYIKEVQTKLTELEPTMQNLSGANGESARSRVITEFAAN